MQYLLHSLLQTRLIVFFCLGVSYLHSVVPHFLRPVFSLVVLITCLFSPSAPLLMWLLPVLSAVTVRTRALTLF